MADLYDSYVNQDFDIPYFLEEAKNARGKVLELTSGTGRVSVPLIRGGIDLTCVDYSTGMLSVLQRKTENGWLPCKLIAMDMTQLALRQKFELIFIPFNSFSEILERDLQKQTLERIMEHLTDSGHFICTLHNERIRLGNIDGRPGTLGQFPTKTGGSLVVRYHFNYDHSTRLAHGFQYYELFDHESRMVGERSLEINFYLFNREEFEVLIHECGFDVVNLYGDYSKSKFDEEHSPFMIWKLRKSDKRTS